MGGPEAVHQDHRRMWTFTPGVGDPARTVGAFGLERQNVGPDRALRHRVLLHTYGEPVLYVQRTYDCQWGRRQPDNLCGWAGITVGQPVDFDGLIRGGQNGKGQLDGANDSRDEGLLVTRERQAAIAPPSEDREPDRDVVADRGHRSAGVKELVVAERARPWVRPVQRVHDPADAVERAADGQ